MRALGDRRTGGARLSRDRAAGGIARPIEQVLAEDFAGQPVALR
ncbi:hypothetical protein [Sphingomonas sp. ACRSK]|nr:hypothetical protein [Sphingomonas sp. ACRSK]